MESIIKLRTPNPATKPGEMAGGGGGGGRAALQGDGTQLSPRPGGDSNRSTPHTTIRFTSLLQRQCEVR